MSANGIEIPCKVNRPKVNSAFKEEQAYLDVDEGLFLHELGICTLEFRGLVDSNSGGGILLSLTSSL